MPLEARSTTKPALLLLELYILAEISALPPALETDARKLVPETLGGTSDDWLATLRDELAGSTVLGDYVRHKWTAWKAERAARGEPADPLAYARIMADERLAATAPRTPARAPDGKLLCSCNCGALAELELDGEYFARACWQRELDEARASGLPADFEKIEREVRVL